jgi:hypothetical protein
MKNNTCSIGAGQFSMLGGDCRLAFPPLSDLDEELSFSQWDDCVAGKCEDYYYRFYGGCWNYNADVNDEGYSECEEWGLVCQNPPPRKRWFNKTKQKKAA